MTVSLLMTENILSEHYTTFCASSGREAIDIYRRERPDMVLSDLRMPGMSGYELQQALRQESQETVPFMFMTADHDEETESKGFDNGAMDFIRKPFRADVLLRRVANILQTVEQIRGLKRCASTDLLTGLLNKSSAEEELTALCRCASGALLMIDLDSFKLVNDIYGHSTGDQLLVRFADILRASMRPADVIGRIGGDEFIAFCQGMKDATYIESKAAYINERLTAAAKALMGEDMSIPLGASIGCVFVPENGTAFSGLYKKADQALYTMKRNGKHGCQVFGGEKPAADEAAALSNLEKILGERNPGKGALVLSFDGFGAVYRFLRRMIRSCHTPVAILRFTLGADAGPEREEAFTETLASTLRTSDVVTRSGRGQFLAILIHVDVQKIACVEERLRKRWAGTEAGADAPFAFEWSVIEP